jgi:hypothetical protein
MEKYSDVDLKAIGCECVYRIYLAQVKMVPVKTASLRERHNFSNHPYGNKALSEECHLLRYNAV